MITAANMTRHQQAKYSHSIDCYPETTSLSECLLSCLLIIAATLSCQDSQPDPLAYLLDSNPYRSHFFFSRPDEQASQIEKRTPLEQLLRQIDKSEREISVFCYSFDQEEILSALVRAKKRGLQIHILGDPEENYEELLKAGFTVERRLRSGLQHVKLMLFDDRWLFTGTGNFTQSGFFHNNNGFWLLEMNAEKSAQLKRMLREETTAEQIHGSDYRIVTAPANGDLIQLVLIQAILSAQRNIQFSIYSFTDPLIMAALLARARDGILIEGIVDDPSQQGQLPSTGQAVPLNLSAGWAPLFLYGDGNQAVFPEEIF